MEALGLRASGLVMGKNYFPANPSANRQESYSLDLAVPRCKELLTVKVSKKQYDEAMVEGQFSCTIGLRVYKGQTYYEAGLDQ